MTNQMKLIAKSSIQFSVARPIDLIDRLFYRSPMLCLFSLVCHPLMLIQYSFKKSETKVITEFIHQTRNRKR